MASTKPVMGTESGSREAFLGNLRDRLANAVEPDSHNPHPIPPKHESTPDVVYVPLADDLLDDFIAHAELIRATVHKSQEPEMSRQKFEDLVKDFGSKTVVFSDHPELQEFKDVAAQMGLEVLANDPSESLRADLGVTVADAAIAGTGSIVQSSQAAGSRSVSILCEIHLALVHRDVIVATPAEILRPLKSPEHMVPNMVLITGPSRTGDIEQILTVGAHGPLELHLLILE